MNIKVLCVGRLKEKFYMEACAEFKKRISRYANMEIAEVADEKAPEQLSPALMEQVKNAEGQRLMDRLLPGEYLIAMDIRGKELTSPELSALMEEVMQSGKSRVAFAIGGSLGLSDAVLQRADKRVSFGKPTFSHQIFRVMLLEQIYRAFKIMRGEPYHK
ncbi:MAG: 23S rRNA (pseudouridine(1915)-N(3))-methyltransferase RlmH [Clostridia bacterium]|nr:23S rRNA (pseudouridine(1915)-N(3))-methyltransferase RlmH [Clostridia bacterium]